MTDNNIVAFVGRVMLIYDVTDVDVILYAGLENMQRNAILRWLSGSHQPLFKRSTVFHACQLVEPPPPRRHHLLRPRRLLSRDHAVVVNVQQTGEQIEDPAGQIRLI